MFLYLKRPIRNSTVPRRLVVSVFVSVECELDQSTRTFNRKKLDIVGVTSAGEIRVHQVHYSIARGFVWDGARHSL